LANLRDFSTRDGMIVHCQSANPFPFRIALQCRQIIIP
jgi:hypothetical protein